MSWATKTAWRGRACVAGGGTQGPYEAAESIQGSAQHARASAHRPQRTPTLCPPPRAGPREGFTLVGASASSAWNTSAGSCEVGGPVGGGEQVGRWKGRAEG